MAPSDSTAMCLYIPLALPLALSSSSDSFVCSYPLASQSTLNCPQPSLSFNLSSTPLLFVPPLSTSQLSSILHSLHCRQICVVVNLVVHSIRMGYYEHSSRLLCSHSRSQKCPRPSIRLKIGEPDSVFGVALH
jgi:hypothetical protein